jgi:hypothetical protein
LSFDCPQRHSLTAIVRSTVRPVPVISSEAPRTSSGPLRKGVTTIAPARCASTCEGLVGASPDALNAAAMCDWSQNGLFFEWRLRTLAEGCPAAGAYAMVRDESHPGDAKALAEWQERYVSM